MFLLNLIMLITGYIWWGIIVFGGVAYLCVLVGQKIFYDGKTKDEAVIDGAIGSQSQMSLFEDMMWDGKERDQ